MSLFLLLESFICLYLSLPLSLFVTFLPPVLSLFGYETLDTNTQRIVFRVNDAGSEELSNLSLEWGWLWLCPAYMYVFVFTISLFWKV